MISNLFVMYFVYISCDYLIVCYYFPILFVMYFVYMLNDFVLFCMCFIGGRADGPSTVVIGKTYTAGSAGLVFIKVLLCYCVPAKREQPRRCTDIMFILLFCFYFV